MYKFSLIIPSYNIEEFYSRFFNSMNNIPNDVEVIFINDKSTDNTQTLIENFIDDKVNMRLINHKKNKGLGGALNTGIANMTTKWYFHVDPDDVIMSNFYSEIKKKISKEKDLMLIRYKFMYRTKEKTFKPSFIERNYFKIAFGWSCGINIEKFGKPKFKEHFKMEDMDMFGRLYKSANGKEGFINKYLIEYTIDRDGSIMNNIGEQTLKDWIVAFNNLDRNKDYKGIRQTLYKMNVKRKIWKHKKNKNIL